MPVSARTRTKELCAVNQVCSVKLPTPPPNTGLARNISIPSYQLPLPPSAAASPAPRSSIPLATLTTPSLPPPPPPPTPPSPPPPHTPPPPPPPPPPHPPPP